jgi:predicted O-methyltransferase YrrM
MFTTPDLFSIVDHYITDLYVKEDDALVEAVTAARGFGLPPIEVSPAQGKFLYLLAKIARARRILEIGTLGGYSTIWLARALAKGGELVTLEADPAAAAAASEAFARAGLEQTVRLLVGDATQTLPAVISETGDPFDLVFLDADKVNYPSYFDLFMQRVSSGSLIVADNVIRAGTVLAPRPDDPSASAARTFNALVAADDRLESIILQQVGIKGHDGLTIARVR